MGEYDDIIDLPHYQAPGRKRMPRAARAAQFMPFKSLNSYHDLVSEKEKDLENVEWEVVEYEVEPGDAAQDFGDEQDFNGADGRDDDERD